MASTEAPMNGNGKPPTTEFELRRENIMGEIGTNLESVLTQINALNRSLEAIIELGHDFANIEALWSQFETVMGKSEEELGVNGEDGGEQEDRKAAE